MECKFLLVLGTMLALLAVDCLEIPHCTFIEGDPLCTTYIYTCFNYKSLPVDLPKAGKTITLKMKENSTITRLYSGALLNTGMANLRKLYLNQCGIERIDQGAFKGGAKLSYLGLSNNKIEWLDLNVFEDLEGLEVLDLSGNPLKSFENMVFPKLNLRELYLNSCGLYEVEEKWFKNLQTLQKLVLDDKGLKKEVNSGFLGILIVVGIILVCGGVCLVYFFWRLKNRPGLPKKIYRMMPKRATKSDPSTAMVTTEVNFALEKDPEVPRYYDYPLLEDKPQYLQETQENIYEKIGGSEYQDSYYLTPISLPHPSRHSRFPPRDAMASYYNTASQSTNLRV